MSNQQLAEVNHQKFEKPKLNSSFKDNIWGASVADM